MILRTNISRPRVPARRRGFVLVTMALTTVGIFGVVGLAVDGGRMLIAKNEMQVYTDSAALAAAMALNGTPAGLTQAITAVTNSQNRWNFGTTAVTDPSV